MTLEELLRPVKTPDGWGYADQFKKIVEEGQEVGAELKKYYDIALKQAESKKVPTSEEYEVLQNSLLNSAIEAGDVMIASAKLINMLGFKLSTILGVCYRKNDKRGYYNE